MKTNIFNVTLLGLFSLSLMPSAYAEDWKMVDHYQVREGLAKDTTTGLIWMRCSMGQNWDGTTCLGEAAKFTWDQAMDVSKHFDYAGFSDWRLPSSDELKTLVHCSSGLTKPYMDEVRTACAEDYATPVIVAEAFPETPERWFWSSSAYARGNGYAWFVSFVFGYDDFGSKSDEGAVRLVRKNR